MTTLNTIIEEEKKEFEKAFVEMSPLRGRDMHNQPPLYNTDFRDVEEIKTFLTTAMQRAYEAGKDERDTCWKERVRKKVESLKSDEDLIQDNEDVVEYATYRAGRALDLNYKDHQAIAERIRYQVLNALDTLLVNLK